MKTLCLNCHWFSFDYDSCKDLRKAFDCSKYQIKLEINQKRENDKELNQPNVWFESLKAKKGF
jgi:hypothetical protein